MCNEFVLKLGKGNLCRKSSDDAMRLTILFVTLDVCSVSLNSIDHDASVLPVECHDITSLLLGFRFIVVKEKPLGLLWLFAVLPFFYCFFFCHGGVRV